MFQPCATTLNSPLSYAIGLYNFNTISNVDEVKKSISVFIVNNSVPLLFQPENKITNGETLLKFKEWPFSLTNEVQPVFLKVYRPVFDISVTTIESSYWSDIFWYLFSPYTIYHLSFLPVTEKGELTDSEYADEVRKSMAIAMKVIGL